MPSILTIYPGFSKPTKLEIGNWFYEEFIEPGLNDADKTRVREDPECRIVFKAECDEVGETDHLECDLILVINRDANDPQVYTFEGEGWSRIRAYFHVVVKRKVVFSWSEPYVLKLLFQPIDPKVYIAQLSQSDSYPSDGFTVPPQMFNVIFKPSPLMTPENLAKTRNPEGFSISGSTHDTTRDVFGSCSFSLHCSEDGKYCLKGGWSNYATETKLKEGQLVEFSWYDNNIELQVIDDPFFFDKYVPRKSPFPANTSKKLSATDASPASSKGFLAHKDMASRFIEKQLYDAEVVCARDTGLRMTAICLDTHRSFKLRLTNSPTRTHEWYLKGAWYDFVKHRGLTKGDTVEFSWMGALKIGIRVITTPTPQPKSPPPTTLAVSMQAPNPDETPTSASSRKRTSSSLETMRFKRSATGGGTQRTQNLGQIGYALVPMIARGIMLGADQPVILHMLDIPPAAEALNGVKMELVDTAFPLLKGVVAATDVVEACKGVNVAVMVDGFPRKEGMERKDVMSKNVSIYKSQASALEQHAAPNCKLEKLSNKLKEPESQLRFILMAWQQIIECRRVLKWTYAYGYYFPQNESAKKHLFEYLQGEAEAGLERLHQCAEKDLSEYTVSENETEETQAQARENFKSFRPKLTGLTSVTRSYFENLARALENGLEDANSQATCSEPMGAQTLSDEMAPVGYFLDHITSLIEQGKTQTVVIAHVDPIELVTWLPALCRKMEVPYCIVQKKTAALCLTSMKNKDKMEFSRLVEAVKENFSDKYGKHRKKWGGGIMGSKSCAKMKAGERVLAKEAA